jgi:hypothetical protein
MKQLLKLAELVAPQMISKLPNAGSSDKITIRIPKSHPKAEALLKLAYALAHRYELESGVVVDKLAIPNADMQFLDCLRDFVNVDEILADLNKAGNSQPNMDEITETLLKNYKSILPGST